MLRLRTFGGLALLDDGQALEGAMAQRRRLALLALLAAAGDRPVSRDKLVGWLWPESDEAKARHSLSQWLFLLRQHLPAGALVGSDELRLDAAVLPSDVAVFRQALAAGDLDAAVSCYEGPFLDGFHLGGPGEFERWADEERRELAAHWRQAAESLARRKLAAADALGAAAVWRRLAADDPTNGRIAQGLMEALDRADDRAGALAHARVHATVLREQLDLPPDPEVEALAERLRRDAERGARRESPPHVVPEPTPASDAEPAAIAAVAGVAGAAREASDEPASRVRAAPRLRVMRATAIAMVLLVGCGAAAFVVVPRRVRATALTLLTRAPATLDPRLVVVAPLDDRTGDSTLAAFGEMVADRTTQALTGTGEFEVADPRAAAITARIVDSIPRLLRDGVRAVAIARETGAATVIAGRYYREGDSLHVYVQVLDAVSGRVLRTLPPAGGRVDALTPLCETVSRRAAGLLAATVDTSLAGYGVGSTPPPSYAAYRETKAAWESYYATDFPHAFEHAARATAIDSSYVLPRLMGAFFDAELRQWRAADSLLRGVDTLAAHGVVPSRMEQASLDMIRADVRGDLTAELSAAEELARLTPGSAEARAHVAHVAVLASRPHVALSWLAKLNPTRGVLLVVPFYYNWMSAALHALGDHRRELVVARRGIRQHPSRDMSALSLVRALGASGTRSAAQEIRAIAGRATQERWPAAAVRRRLLVEGSRELRAHGDAADATTLLDAALAEFDALARRAPGDTSVALLEARAVLLAEAGRLADAREAATRLLARDPRHVAALGVLGVVAARGGDAAAARRADSLLAALPSAYLLGRHTLWRARIAAASGDRPRAVALLERAMGEGYPVVQGIASHTRDLSEFDYAETLVHADPALASLRGDPAFERLVAPNG